MHTHNNPAPPAPGRSLEFMDPAVDTTPIAPALAEFFDDVLADSVSQLNFRAIVDGLGGVLFQYPFRRVVLGGWGVGLGLRRAPPVHSRLLGAPHSPPTHTSPLPRPPAGSPPTTP